MQMRKLTSSLLLSSHSGQGQCPDFASIILLAVLHRPENSFTITDFDSDRHASVFHEWIQHTNISDADSAVNGRVVWGQAIKKCSKILELVHLCQFLPICPYIQAFLLWYYGYQINARTIKYSTFSLGSMVESESAEGMWGGEEVWGWITQSRSGT